MPLRFSTLPCGKQEEQDYNRGVPVERLPRVTTGPAGLHPMVPDPCVAYRTGMNRNLGFVIATAVLVTATTLLFVMTGCVTDDYGHNRVRGSAYVSFEDDYDYYPRYETYYSRNRREFVYRDGSQWVRRREPRGVSTAVILATPSVRLDFRDSPERHHNDVIRSYPRDWQGNSLSVQVQGTSAGIQVQGGVMFEDDYDYYPRYETYYSRGRREYVYRDGNQWVRRPQPRGVSLRALQSAQSVRMEFRDSPERHHDNVVRSYPKNWKRQDKRNDRRNNDRDDRRDGR